MSEPPIAPGQAVADEIRQRASGRHGPRRDGFQCESMARRRGKATRLDYADKWLRPAPHFERRGDEHGNAERTGGGSRARTGPVPRTVRRRATYAIQRVPFAYG